MRGRQYRGRREKALTTTLVKGTQPSPLLPCLICLHYLASKWESLQVDSGQQGRQCTRCGCAAHLTLAARVGPVLPQSAFGCVLSHLITLSLNDLHSTMSCMLSEELAPTPLEAVQVMVAKALSLVTLVTLRVLVTLSSDMEASVELVMTRVTPSSFKSTPFLNQEMVGAGTPVAVHISASEAPSEMVAMGFWEAKMAASGATEQREERICTYNQCMMMVMIIGPMMGWS